MTWNRDMDAAPRDGSPVFLKTRHGALVEAGWKNGQWVSTGEYPPSWAYGVCSDVNHLGKPSDPPIAWWEEART